MQSQELIIANPRGLHPEVCAKIVNIGKQFRCNLFLVCKGRRVSARNIVSVILLTAALGATVRVEADGPDEALAIREIATLLHDGLGERR